MASDGWKLAGHASLVVLHDGLRHLRNWSLCRGFIRTQTVVERLDADPQHGGGGFSRFGVLNSGENKSLLHCIDAVADRNLERSIVRLGVERRFARQAK